MPTPRSALRQARIDLGLTLGKAATAAGYKSKSGWAMVEAGINTPDLDQIRRMADVVGKPAYEVFPELRALLPEQPEREATVSD